MTKNTSFIKRQCWIQKKEAALGSYENHSPCSFSQSLLRHAKCAALKHFIALCSLEHCEGCVAMPIGDITHSISSNAVKKTVFTLICRRDLFCSNSRYRKLRSKEVEDDWSILLIIIDTKKLKVGIRTNYALQFSSQAIRTFIYFVDHVTC